MNHQQFLRDMKKASEQTEEQVKEVFSTCFSSDLGVSVIAGRVDLRTKAILFELKKVGDLSNIQTRAKILAQALYYVQKIITGVKARSHVPFALSAVTSSGMAIVEVSKLLEVFSGPPTRFDWGRTASQPDVALVNYLKTLPAIAEAKVYHFKNKDHFSEIGPALAACRDGQSPAKCKITYRNFEDVYAHWREEIGGDVESSIKASDKPYPGLHRFFTLELQYSGSGLGNNIMYDSNGRCLRFFFNGFNKLPDLTVNLNWEKYESFWQLYARPTDETEYKNIVSKIDHIKELADRREKGEYYTHPSVAQKAHEYLANHLGENWFREYKIWDMAAGSGNLVVDLIAQHPEARKNIFLSTLDSSEVSFLTKDGFFQNVTSFQFDYTNDSYKDLPQQLRTELENKKNKWLIFVNPPYGTPSSGLNDKSKKKVGLTRVAQEMTSFEDENGKKPLAKTKEMFFQFLFRMCKEMPAPFKLGLFATPKYINGDTANGLRQHAFKGIFRGGFLVRGDSFSGASDIFPVSFAIWDVDSKTSLTGQNCVFDVMDFEESGHTLILSKLPEAKEFTDTAEDQFLQRWVTKPRNTEPAIPLKGPTKVAREGKIRLDKLAKDALGFLWCNGNDVQQAGRTKLFSSAYMHNNGWSVTKDNFEKSLIILATRWSVKNDWLTHRDLFLKPLNEPLLTAGVIFDFVVFGLFCDGDCAAAMDGENYGQVQDQKIKNNFFPFSKDFAKQFVTEQVVRNSMTIDTESFAYDYLKAAKSSLSEVSKESSELLSAAEAYWTACYKLRTKAPGIRHLQNWDIGRYQVNEALKALLKSGKLTDEERKDIKDAMALFKKKQIALQDKVYVLANQFKMISGGRLPAPLELNVENDVNVEEKVSR